MSHQHDQIAKDMFTIRTHWNYYCVLEEISISQTFTNVVFKNGQFYFDKRRIGSMIINEAAFYKNKRQ